MDIGDKIKAARIQAQFTQEQAAEVLGVSRQTISNWENGKTYPDIVSVIKMSDLYQVSLDRLLKGESASKGYLDYLEESTNAVNGKKKFSRLVIACVYLAIWAVSLLVFWCFTSGSDAMGYSILFLWVLLPVSTFQVALFLGKSGGFGPWGALSAPCFGCMYMLAEYATFGAASMASSGVFHLPRLPMLLPGTLIALAGWAVGFGLQRLKKREKNA